MKRILVVDDDGRVLFVLHDILAGLGSQYEVVTAQTGNEALDKAREMSFDLLKVEPDPSSSPAHPECARGGLQIQGVETVRRERLLTPIGG